MVAAKKFLVAEKWTEILTHSWEIFENQTDKVVFQQPYSDPQKLLLFLGLLLLIFNKSILDSKTHWDPPLHTVVDKFKVPLIFRFMVKRGWSKRKILTYKPLPQMVTTSNSNYFACCFSVGVTLGCCHELRSHVINIASTTRS